jgi:4-hydroxybenzoate polyprenyltransferase
MRDLAPFARLVRLPAAFTAPGDVLAGAAAAGWPMGNRTALLPLSSILIYWAGMALNDYADRELDAVERPERPIPSGAVSAGEALGVAVALSASGIAIAGIAGGRRSLAVALPLVGAVWAYDLVFKSTPLGPAAMASTRLLDVLLGAGQGSLRRAMPAALTVATHTLGTTVLSRDEVHGSRSQAVAGLAIAGTAMAAGAAANPFGQRAATRAGRLAHRLASAALAGWYCVQVIPPQSRARASRAATDVRRAVGASVVGTIPLQAALVARHAPILGAFVGCLLPLARRLSKRVVVT